MYNSIKTALKSIPGAVGTYRVARRKLKAHQLRGKSREEIFTTIFRQNLWRGDESASGTGSDRSQVSKIAQLIPVMLKDLEISVMLDVPCGDHYWMKTMDLGNIKYMGADLVDELIQKNRVYENHDKRFLTLDLISDELPDADLVLCRDCLVHFSFADILKALKNICSTKATYLLTTTFPTRKFNWDIVTGQWRVLNLEASPFYLPQPLRLMVEECSEAGGEYRDKSLGLWRIRDVKEALEHSFEKILS